MTIRALVVFAFLSASCTAPAATAGTPTAPSSAPTPATDPAGTVVAVKGAAQAINAAGVARVLTQGEGVWPDETVKTPRDASIDIRLRHNGVVWSMRGGLQKRVDQSLAWTAPKASTSNVLFSTVADASRVSAGRHSENEAAHSAESLLQAKEEKKGDARFGATGDLAPGGGGGAAAGRASTGASRDEATAESSRSSNVVASKEETKSKQEKAKPPERIAQTAKSTGAIAAKASNAAPAPAPASVVAPPAEVAMVEKDRADSGAMLGDAMSPASDKPATRATGWAVSDTGARAPADLAKVLNALRLDRCATRTLAIAFRAQIEADGRVGELVLLDAQGGDAADLLCIEEALRTANFGAGAPGVVSIRYAR